jgi:ADP-heptose:LPS heptosyltransferase
MGKWPSSLPEYHWPAKLLSKRHAPRRWALALAFHLAYAVGRLLSVLRKGAQAILVIRTDGIGDAVLFEPALRSLGRSFPDSPIHLWAPAATCDLLAEHPAVSHRLAIPRGAKPGNLEYFASIRWRAVMGWRLGKYRFDIALYAVQSPEPLGNWIVSSVRAREKWYARGDTENQFESQRTRTSAIATRLLHISNTEEHELLRNASIARQWGGTVTPTPELKVGDQARLLARTIASQWRRVVSEKGAAEIVGIMAGSATAVNAYPIPSWASVIRSLWHTRRAIVVLFGGAGDVRRVDELAALLVDIPHLRLPPLTNLRTTGALLGELDGFVSMDTGLAHIALAQNVPTVVLANGGHPNRFFPWPIPRRSVTLTHRMPCEGCLCRCVLAEPECVTRISPDEVVATYERLVPCMIASPDQRSGAFLPKDLLTQLTPHAGVERRADARIAGTRAAAPPRIFGAI